MQGSRVWDTLRAHRALTLLHLDLVAIRARMCGGTWPPSLRASERGVCAVALPCSSLPLCHLTSHAMCPFTSPILTTFTVALHFSHFYRLVFPSVSCLKARKILCVIALALGQVLPQESEGLDAI